MSTVTLNKQEADRLLAENRVLWMFIDELNPSVRDLLEAEIAVVLAMGAGK